MIYTSIVPLYAHAYGLEVRAIPSEITEYGEFVTTISDSTESAKRTYLIGWECEAWSANAAAV